MTSSSNSQKPIIVLVRPQMGRNIGASIRAMVNCGFYDLRLVDPRDGWPDPEADDLSAGAIELMNDVQVYKTLEDAISDCQLVLGTTARRRDMVKEIYTAKTACKKAFQDIHNGLNVAFLFGPERTGLLNDDIAQCTGIITIPLNPDFSSLNLAQAVLLLTYEYSQLIYSQDLPEQNFYTGDSPTATQKEIRDFLERLIQEMNDGHFFRNKDVRPHLERNISNLVTRAQPTEQEIKTLHGIVSALIGRKKQRSNSDSVDTLGNSHS